MYQLKSLGLPTSVKINGDIAELATESSLSMKFEGMDILKKISMSIDQATATFDLDRLCITVGKGILASTYDAMNKILERGGKLRNVHIGKDSDVITLSFQRQTTAPMIFTCPHCYTFHHFNKVGVYNCAVCKNDFSMNEEQYNGIKYV